MYFVWLYIQIYLSISDRTSHKSPSTSTCCLNLFITVVKEDIFWLKDPNAGISGKSLDIIFHGLILSLVFFNTIWIFLNENLIIFNELLDDSLISLKE